MGQPLDRGAEGVAGLGLDSADVEAAYGGATFAAVVGADGAAIPLPRS
jgi:hypothetical protein